MILSEYRRFLQTLTNAGSHDLRKMANLVLVHWNVLLPLTTAQGHRVKKLAELAQANWETVSADIQPISGQTTAIGRLTVNMVRCSANALQYARAFTLETDMSTTTICLTEDLKARVATAAKRAGTSTHGFILEAIAEKMAQVGQHADFDAVAEERYARIVSTGKTVPWQEMRAYLKEHFAGKKIKRPVARKLALKLSQPVTKPPVPTK